jgi:vacuolar-type H+-ATPase subunit H
VAEAAPGETAEQAINRVLAAERRAREAIAGCEAEGKRLVEDARGRVKRIGQRTEARIAKLRDRCDVTMRERMAALDAAGEAENADLELDQAKLSRLETAVRLLAERLTGKEG